MELLLGRTFELLDPVPTFEVPVLLLVEGRLTLLLWLPVPVLPLPVTELLWLLVPALLLVDGRLTSLLWLVLGLTVALGAGAVPLSLGALGVLGAARGGVLFHSLWLAG